MLEAPVTWLVFQMSERTKDLLGAWFLSLTYVGRALLPITLVLASLQFLFAVLFGLVAEALK